MLAGRWTNDEPEDRRLEGETDIDVKVYMVAPTRAGETGARGPRPDPADDIEMHTVGTTWAGETGARGPRPYPAKTFKCE